MTKTTDSQDSRSTHRGGAGFLTGAGLLLLACWFMWGFDLVDIPTTKAAAVPDGALSNTPRRTILTDPPVIELDGFERSCAECHRYFPARDMAPEQLWKHRHIVLDHGINNQCRNCHFAEDRNRLVLHDGTPIGFGEVVVLCAKCHGPTYRDWERGMHGRTNGFWDSSLGEPRQLACTECHDPHNPRVPAMDPLAPLPPPDTIRMGAQKEHGRGKAVEVDPLRRVLLEGQEEKTSHDL